MAKRVRGNTQIDTYGNSAFTGAALAMATDVRDGTQPAGVGGMQIEFYKHLQGQIMTGNPNLALSQISEPQFKQNNDLTTLYQNRSFEIINDQISEQIYNNQNEFLITVALPLFVTNEMSFHNTRKEWNQIDWTHVSETGLGEQGTFSSWTWSDKMVRRKMEAEMTLESVMDANYGATVWDENLGFLAGTGLLTLMKEAAYGCYTMGYANEIEDKVSNMPVNLSALFRWETQSFHCAAKSADEFLWNCQQAMQKLPGQTNIVIIMPNGTSMRMRHAAGETKPAQGVLITLNPQTQDYELRTFEGPRPVMTVQLGNVSCQVYEMPGFKVNSRSDLIEDPSTARTTQCQVLPCNPDSKLSDAPHRCDNQTNDMWVFYQDQEVGEYRRIAFADMLTNCFGYDPISGAPSAYVEQLRNEKNDSMERSEKWPVEFDVQNNKSGTAVYDINDENPHFDYDRPNAVEIGAETDLQQMTSWRHHCCLLTFDPRVGMWRIPQLMGDFQLSKIPNAAFLKAARQLVMAHDHSVAGRAPQLNDTLQELRAMLTEINATPWTAEYVRAVVNTNAPFLQGDMSAWPVNKHGSLRLPVAGAGGLDNMFWPPGFGFGGGLNTIEEEGNNTRSPFYAASQRVSQWKKGGGARLLAFLEEALGADTAVLDGSLADDVQQGKASALDTLVATVAGRPRFVLMGVPGETGEPNAGANPVSTLTAAIAASDTGIIDLGTFSVPPDPVLRALYSLNAATIAEVKNFFMSYYDAATPADQADLVRRLADEILLVVPFESDAAGNAVGSASMMAHEVFQASGGGANVKEALALLSKFRSKKFQDDRKKSWLNSPIYTDNVAPARQTLRDAENRVRAAPVREANAGAVDTGRSPLTYLPAALAANDQLDAFVTTERNYWIVPQGPAMKPVKTQADMRERDALLKRIAETHKGLSRLAGIHSLKATKGLYSNAMDVEQPQRRTIFGANAVSGSNLPGRQRTQKSGGAAMAADDVHDTYFGPWRNRLEFASKIADPAVQLMFLALIQASNTLQTLLGINEVAGAKLINVLCFRPFIESTAKSTVVMQGQGEAGLTAMSRVKALVSKEDRGVVHVGASMYTACVRRNPQGVRLVPLSHPHTFIGGKQLNFVTDPRQMMYSSELRPSIVALPTAITETIYKYPVDMNNQETFLRPGLDNDLHFRKHSAADLYRVVFGARRIASVKEHHAQRTRYWDYVEVCHVGYLGPRRFMGANGKLVHHRGTGPGNDDCMNIEGAEKVWNGAPLNYPQEIPQVVHYDRAGGGG